MEITKELLTKAIDTVIGTRAYLPISESEGILVFERKGYVHLFKQLASVSGGRSAYIAERILDIKQEEQFNYHPELLELINGF